MKNIWLSLKLSYYGKRIEDPDSLMNLITSYGAKGIVFDQIKNFVIKDSKPEETTGFINMAFKIEDCIFSTRAWQRPHRYFETLINFKKIPVAENFITGEKEYDLEISFTKVQELSKWQYKKLLNHFNSKNNAEKTMRLFRNYASVYKKP